MNEEIVDVVKPYFSRCSVGKAKWFWVAYGSFEDMCEGKIHSFGMAAGSEEAEREARASLARDYGTPAWQWVGHAAREVYRRMGVKRRAARPSGGKDAAPQEFLYTHYYSDYDGAPSSTRHRVVKKTAKRVFIERRCDSWKEGGETYYDVQTIALDREELEREGCVYSRRGHDLFHTTPHDARHVAFTPPCLAFLCVDQPCTIEEVEKAYRRLAMKLHPDHGGDAESFKSLQRAYEEALRLLA